MSVPSSVASTYVTRSRTLAGQGGEAARMCAKDDYILCITLVREERHSSAGRVYHYRAPHSGALSLRRESYRRVYSA